MSTFTVVAELNSNIVVPCRFSISNHVNLFMYNEHLFRKDEHVACELTDNDDRQGRVTDKMRNTTMKRRFEGDP